MKQRLAMGGLLRGWIILFISLIISLMLIPPGIAQTNPDTAAPKTKSADQGPSGYLFTGLAGGYFFPLGTEGDILEAGWCVKAFVYKNRMAGKALGMGFEATFADLKDTENSGGVKYMPGIGYLNLSIDILGILEIQPKAGLGLTTLLAKIDNGEEVKNDYSVDFTLSIGLGVQKILYEHYVIGASFDYFYIFQRDPSKAQALNFFAGYKF